MLIIEGDLFWTSAYVVNHTREAESWVEIKKAYMLNWRLMSRAQLLDS